MSPEAGVRSSAGQIEGKYGQSCKDAFDPCLGPDLSRRRAQTMDTVEQFGGRDGGEGEIGLTVLGDESIQIEIATLAGDQNAGVDQRGQRVSSAGGWFSTPSATASR